MLTVIRATMITCDVKICTQWSGNYNSKRI